MEHQLEPPDPDAQLGYLLVRAADRVSRHWSARLRANKINPRQFSMLAVLARDPGISQNELARRIMITPQSVGESISALVQAGLVSRSEAEPGRPVRLKLLAAGRRLLKKAYPVVEAVNQESFAELTDSERRELLRLLHKITDNSTR